MAGIRRKFHDWTSKDLPAEYPLTPFQQFTRNIDWKKSPLGPMESWPHQLRQTVLLIVADPSPAVVYWGEEQTIVYNEAYTHLIGNKHPSLQGQDPKIGFAEIWDQFDKIIRTGQETGETHIGDNQMLLLHRYGFLEETYYSWKFIPMIGDEGYVVASYATVVEVTREVISDRRLNFMRQLSQQMARAEDLNTFWPNLLEGLEQNEKDIPIALLYSIDVNTGKNANQMDRKPKDCVLKGAIGIPDGHVAALKKIKIEDDNTGFAPAIRTSLRSRDVILLQTKDSSLDEFLLSDLSSRGFKAPCRQVLVCPIRSMADDVLGVVIIGLNPRKPYNSDYRGFVDALMRQVIGPSYMSSILLAEEVRRTEIDRAMLSEQLVARTKAFERSETRFQNFADKCPIAITIIAIDGAVLYANEPWYSFTMVDPEKPEAKMAWLDGVLPEDRHLVEDWWRKVTEQKMSGTFSFRTKRPYIGYSATGLKMESPVSTGLCTAYPNLDEEGNVETVTGIIHNVSELKWTEESLQVRMEEALTMKRQQEKFMDMISHEIRNPLSAMLHCSEEIISSLKTYLSGMNAPEILSARTPSPHIPQPECNSKVLEEAIDTANTIVYCIQHQRRVVDDVLMLSKLDSDLLTICPHPVQPIVMVQDALKMFEGELRKADITLDMDEDPSMHDLKAEWVSLDPSRVLQILLNLCTNAIKFTRTELTRQIMVKISASLEKPSEGHNGTGYLPRRPKPISRQTADVTDSLAKIRSKHNTSDDLYLSFSVTDTGKGMSEKEMKALFNRFAQATPKTSSVYGGSGLGLWISRQIAEMLDGAIGVTSEEGKGSCFAFFVKTQRTFEPRRKSMMELHIPPAIKISLDSLASDTNAAIAGEESLAEAEEASSSPVALDTLQLVNVLVVEDNLINQKVVSTQLRKRGYKVEVANHGVEALAELKRTINAGGGNQNFDVVLMDLEMPVMGGLECIQNIRRIEREGVLIGHVPVIAVTANVRSMHVDAAMEAGMDGVTTKPYRMQDLVAQIDQARQISSKSSSRTSTPIPGSRRSVER